MGLHRCSGSHHQPGLHTQHTGSLATLGFGAVHQAEFLREVGMER